MYGQFDSEKKEIQWYEKLESRNKEAFFLVCLLYIIWIIPFIIASEVGGLVSYVYLIFAALSIIGALILFLPIRWLVRLSLDGRKKTPARITILIIIALAITYMVMSFAPVYDNSMEYEANKYYNENPHEFDDPFEGKTIYIHPFSGPYITYFVYTNDDPPMRQKGGVVIDYKNGWYFSGWFAPA